MISKELSDIFKSKKTWIIVIIMFLIPIVDLALNVYAVYWDFWTHKEAYSYFLSPDRIYHPSMGAFLSGTSVGHMPQMLLIWLLPIFLLLIYSDTYIKEYQLKYHYIISTRIQNVKIFLAKLLAGFIIGFITVFLSLSLNYILSWIAFNGGTSFRGLDYFIGTEESLLSISLENPVITYIIYIFNFSVISGLYSIVCVSLSFCFRTYKLLYGVCIIIWFWQILSPYSLTFIIQPFIEYGFERIIPAAAVLILIVIVAVAVGYYSKVKYERI